MTRLTPCRQAGCGATVDGGGYCERHRRDNDRSRDATRKLYRSPAWEGRCGVAPNLRARNPICQKLHAVNGRLEQCHNPSYLVHHRWSPQMRPDLALKVYDETGTSNLIALCRKCHPQSEGTPEWREAKAGDHVPAGGGEFFLRTEWRITI